MVSSRPLAGKFAGLVCRSTHFKVRRTRMFSSSSFLIQTICWVLSTIWIDSNPPVNQLVEEKKKANSLYLLWSICLLNFERGEKKKKRISQCLPQEHILICQHWPGHFNLHKQWRLVAPCLCIVFLYYSPTLKPDGTCFTTWCHATIGLIVSCGQALRNFSCQLLRIVIIKKEEDYT